MKKNTLLTVLMVFLMVMNGILLYLVVNGNDGEQKNRPGRMFIPNHLDFTPKQRTAFSELEEAHHQKMQHIDQQYRRLKEVLFGNLPTSRLSTSEMDSIGKRIGILAAEREMEVFTHFSNIQDLCKPEQKSKLHEIVKGALHPGPPRHRPPPHGGPPPPR